MSKLTDAQYTSLFEISGTVSKRIRDAALRSYLDYQKTGKPIPQPLQDYINWGLQRTLDDERAPFPVTRREKHNPYTILLSVKLLIEKKGRTEDQAVDEVAAYYDMTEKRVSEIYTKLENDPPKGLIYYLSEIW